MKKVVINLREMLLFILFVVIMSAWFTNVAFAWECVIDDDGMISCADSINN